MASGAAGEVDHHAVIVGAGIGAASRLSRAGLADYLIVEEGDGFGGTWYWNRYPGVAVDIPSFSYQFSFAKHTNWSRVYAPGVLTQPKLPDIEGVEIAGITMHTARWDPRHTLRMWRSRRFPLADYRFEAATP
jgi:cation diffusion facilitator CzcD-associated flavoprotein CzcO